MPTSLNDYLRINAAGRARLAEVDARYRRLHTDPAGCQPMILVSTPVKLPCWEERLADPLVMLRSELDALRPHLEIGDDRVATVRVQFGTAAVAAAFGCPLSVPTNSLPAAAGHALARIEDVATLAKPSLDAGWYGKLWEWTRLWQEHLPEGIHIQHPDIQSPFNTAHLVRGNDILLDFYDHPKAVGHLLDLVTDFMIDLTRHAKAMISADREWFYDWGSLWKGAARISNCSMHLISPEFYREFVLPRDVRFFAAIGGGRVHYCGTHAEVIRAFCGIPDVHGLDVDTVHHDFFELCRLCPPHVVLAPTNAFPGDGPVVQRLLRGDWPRKRNLIVPVTAPSVEAGRELLARLRASHG